MDAYDVLTGRERMQPRRKLAKGISREDKMTVRSLRWISIAWLLLTAPALAQDKATIEALNARFAAAFNNGDYKAVAAFYADDANVLPPGSEIVKGRGNIQSFWTKTGEGLGDVKLTTIEVTPLGNLAAREIGTFTAKTKASPPQTVEGKYVVIWQKVGDDWRIATDIWNGNK
jgi:uncharacterized protein (TIGR02246 family)